MLNRGDKNFNSPGLLFSRFAYTLDPSEGSRDAGGIGRFAIIFSSFTQTQLVACFLDAAESSDESGDAQDPKEDYIRKHQIGLPSNCQHLFPLHTRDVPTR